MVINSVGEIPARVYDPLKVGALNRYGFGLCVYVGFTHGTDALQLAVNLGLEKLAMASVVPSLLLLYISPQ